MIDPRKDPTRRCRKVEDWPCLDQECWAKGQIKPRRLISKGGAGAFWAPESIEKFRKGYGRWLTYLDTHDHLDISQSPGERVNLESVLDYVAELEAQGVSPNTVQGRLNELHHALRAMAPDNDWAWLREIIARHAAAGLRGRPKRPRMIPIIEIVEWSTAELLATPDEGPPSIKQAVRYRDALILLMLSFVPLRRSNMASIRINHHMDLEEGVYVLRFEGPEMKNREPYEAEYPEELTPLIDTWLTRYRPRLLRGNVTDRYWLSRNGNPMNARNLYARVTRTTEFAFGKPVNPHLFRDMAMTDMAHMRPELIRAMADLLHHRSYKTGERHYNQAGSIAASRRHNATLKRIRKTAPLAASLAGYTRRQSHSPLTSKPNHPRRSSQT